jgi:hypothetical protein
VPQNSDIAPVLYSQYKKDAPWHLELILLCPQTIPVNTWQRNMEIKFSANCNAASLECEVIVWVLEHRDQWMNNSGDPLLHKT